MLATIQLDHQAFFETIEIYDVIADTVLASEFHADPIVSQAGPEYAFLGSRFFSEGAAVGAGEGVVDEEHGGIA